MGRFSVVQPDSPPGRFAVGRFFVPPEQEPGAWEADPTSPDRERRQRPAGGWEFRAKAPDFSDVQSSSSTVSAGQVAKRQRMADARRFAQEQERSVAPPPPGEEGVNPASRPPTGPESTAVLGDLARRFAGGVRGGMTEGADFLLHLPETIGRAVGTPFAVAAEEERRKKVYDAQHPDEGPTSFWAPPEPGSPPARPLPAPEGLTALGVPAIVEETFQNARKERERRGADPPPYLRTEGDPAYSAGRVTGNLLDPTMLLAGEGGIAGKIETRLADRAEKELAAQAARQGVEGLAEEEARMLSRRDAFMRTQPPADVSAEIPGASRWGSESSIGQVGQHVDDVAQSQALGMRASREDGVRLATSAEEPARVRFRTAKGSEYEVLPDGTTVRNKAPRPEHPGDFGPQPPSETTFYVAPEHANALGEIQARGGPARAVVLSEDGTHAAIKYMDGPSAGKIERRTVVPVERSPRAGAIPVEVWNDGGRVHFGNPITEIEGGAAKGFHGEADAALRAMGMEPAPRPSLEEIFAAPDHQAEPLYHVVTGGKWDGGDLLPLSSRLGDATREAELVKLGQRWPDLIAGEDVSDPSSWLPSSWRHLEEYAAGDAGQVHLHGSLEAAQGYAKEHGGEILRVDPAGLKVGNGAEYPHPVVEGSVPASAVERMQEGPRVRGGGLPNPEPLYGGEHTPAVEAAASPDPEWADLAPKRAWTDPSPPGLTTGTKKAVTEAERAARGLPEVEALGRKSSGENWLAARAAFEADPQAARDLASHVAGNPRPLSGMENDLLLHDRMKLTVDHLDALDAEAQALAAGDTEAAAMAKIRRTSLESAMQVNDAAAKRSGTAWHESGMARQKLIAEDYSPLRLTTRAKVAAAEGGRELPEVVRQQLVETAQQLEAAQAKLAGYEEWVSQMEAERAVKAVQRDVARAGRSGARRGDAVALDAEYSDLSKRFAAISNTPRAGLDPELAALVAKMARNRVQRGAKGLAEVVDGIYQDIRPHVDGLEPRDVRDAISGYGVTRTHPARSEAVLELARIKQEARTLSALEDAQAAGRPAAELDALQRKVDQISGGTALPGRGPASDAERLVATKARLARREKELTQQLAEGYFPKKVRRPLALDPDAIALQGRIEELKRKADRIIQREEMKNRTPWEKITDWAPGWGRFLKLSGIASTPQKLVAAASQRSLIWRPIEEFIGAVESHLPIVKHFAANAPIEGGGSIKAIAKSYAAFFGKEARGDLVAGLKGKEGPWSLAMGSELEEGVAHGKNVGRVPEWMEYPGKLHGGLKAPAKIAGFEYAMEKQALWYLKRGEGEMLKNPATIAEMKARAYEFAARDIFMGDNRLVRAFRAGLSRLSPGGQAVGNTLFPIVKVPTNYALEITDYAGGLVKAPAKMTRTIYRGMKATAGSADRGLGEIVAAGLKAIDADLAEKGLSAGYADQIMRQLKKGSLGAGLIALGASGLVAAGGYYAPGRSANEDLHPGDIAIGGIKIPHLWLHHPAIEMIQIGVTIARERDIEKGIINAFYGVTEQVPFGELMTEGLMGNSRDRGGSVTKFLGGVERGFTIQPDAQRLARVMDQKEEPSTGEKVGQTLGLGGLKLGDFEIPEIETVRRKPRGDFLERLRKEELLGIPGLRQRAGGYQEEDAEP